MTTDQDSLKEGRRITDDERHVLHLAHQRVADAINREILPPLNPVPWYDLSTPEGTDRFVKMVRIQEGTSDRPWAITITVGDREALLLDDQAHVVSWQDPPNRLDITLLVFLSLLRDWKFKLTQLPWIFIIVIKRGEIHHFNS